MSEVVPLGAGTRFVFDGETVEVVEFDGKRVTIRDAQDQWRAVAIGAFVDRAKYLGQVDGDVSRSVGLNLAVLGSAERQQLAERAAHIRELLTGYRSGHAGSAAAGEPCEAYPNARPLRDGRPRRRLSWGCLIARSVGGFADIANKARRAWLTRVG